eukprot:757603-Hanusia_phi.AAC.2
MPMLLVTILLFPSSSTGSLFSIPHSIQRFTTIQSYSLNLQQSSPPPHSSPSCYPWETSAGAPARSFPARARQAGSCWDFR